MTLSIKLQNVLEGSQVAQFVEDWFLSTITEYITKHIA